MLNGKNQNTSLQRIRNFCRVSILIMIVLIMIFSIVQSFEVYFLPSIKVMITFSTIFCINEALIYNQRKDKKIVYVVFNILSVIFCIVILVFALFSF